jgi:DNA integrity scanning protein DisA with diadenylate cyclase activity
MQVCVEGSMFQDVMVFLKDLDSSWNSHDLERILSHYSEDYMLVSPVVKRVLGIEDGTLVGKEAVRKWWRRVLDKVPDLKFSIIDIAENINSIAMVFKSSHNNKNVVSIFYFNDEGKIIKEYFYE